MRVFLASLSCGCYSEAPSRSASLRIQISLWFEPDFKKWCRTFGLIIAVLNPIGWCFEQQPITAFGLEGQKEPAASCQRSQRLRPSPSALMLIYSAVDLYFSSDYFAIKHNHFCPVCCCVFELLSRDVCVVLLCGLTEVSLRSRVLKWSVTLKDACQCRRLLNDFENIKELQSSHVNIH